MANIALHACFVDLEKAFDRVPRDKLWKVLREYGADGQLLRAIKSFYCRPEVCVQVSRFVTSPFHCLHQGSPNFFSEGRITARLTAAGWVQNATRQTSPVI